MNYRKKPVVIEAVKWNGNNFRNEILDFIPSARLNNAQQAVYIDTLEGTMRADKDDWIIKGIKGEFYPCKPDIFEATYELVGE